MTDPQTIASKLTKALADYDAKAATCPFAQRRTPPRLALCPKCCARSNQSCRVIDRAANDFVELVRTHLEKEASK